MHCMYEPAIVIKTITDNLKLPVKITTAARHITKERVIPYMAPLTAIISENISTHVSLVWNPSFSISGISGSSKTLRVKFSHLWKSSNTLNADFPLYVVLKKKIFRLYKKNSIAYMGSDWV